jgi:hypothetical protein
MGIGRIEKRVNSLVALQVHDPQQLPGPHHTHQGSPAGTIESARSS